LDMAPDLTLSCPQAAGTESQAANITARAAVHFRLDFIRVSSPKV
jgi:hypothetical protein